MAPAWTHSLPLREDAVARAAQQAVAADGRALSQPEPSYLSPVVGYHGLGRRDLLASRLLMRPQLNGGTLGGRVETARLDKIVDDDDFEEWISSQRHHVEEYLRAQGIPDPNVGPWPAFEVAPKFAIWPVESKKVSGKIGWWAFSGDCPTDYVSEDGQCHPRSALRKLLERWRTYVVFMKRGQQPPNATFGESVNLQDLATLLEKRIELLAEWVLEDDLWRER